MENTKSSGLRAGDLALIGIFAALITLCSWISIPMTIPITLQTFAVFMAAGLLGTKRAALTVLLYIMMAAAGLPVLSGFRGGIGALMGPTGGYVIGFVFTALITGSTVGRLGRRPAIMLISMTAGALVCYAFGTLWFVCVYAAGSGNMGFVSALSLCVLPYLIPDAVKMILAVIVIGRLDGALRGGRA